MTKPRKPKNQKDSNSFEICQTVHNLLSEMDNAYNLDKESNKKK